MIQINNQKRPEPAALWYKTVFLFMPPRNPPFPPGISARHSPAPAGSPSRFCRTPRPSNSRRRAPCSRIPGPRPGAFSLCTGSRRRQSPSSDPRSSLSSLSRTSFPAPFRFVPSQRQEKKLSRSSTTVTTRMNSPQIIAPIRSISFFLAGCPGPRLTGAFGALPVSRHTHRTSLDA